jgi:hypothetical protein
VGDGGWVALAEPIIVPAGEAFVAVPATLPFIRHETDAADDAIR